MRMCVIDDDRLFSEPLLWCLEQEGWAVTWHRNVDDFLDEQGRLKGERPDCIILDMMMPRGNRYSATETDCGRSTGLRVLQDIAQSGLYIPTIVVTVRCDLDLVDLSKRYASCVKAILAKPVTPTRILKCLERIFPDRKTKG